jgi:outer membrane protein assembly factor BamB
MSTPPTAPVSGSWMRRLPLLLVLLLALGIGVLQWLPGEVPDLGQRNFLSVLAGLLALLLVFFWALFLSGWRWGFRLLPILLVGGVAAAVENVEFTGDMRPMITWRGSPKRVEVVKAAREKQPKSEALPLTDVTAYDWPAFRGARGDGIALGYTLNLKWDQQAPKELWRQPCGTGYASFAVAGKSAVTIEQRGDKEVVVCYDADTGSERWVYEHTNRFWEALGGEGPRATPTIADGDVYSLGASGHFVRLDGQTGKPKWTVNILEGNENLTWGMAGSPLVYDDLVVVTPGAQTAAAKGKGVQAYQRDSGTLKWSAGDHQGGYSSPVLATLGGVKQIIVFDGGGVSGYDADGKGELWRLPWPVQQGINVAQPIVIDDEKIFISSGYGVGCALLKVAESGGKWSVSTLWKNTNLKCKFTSPVRNGPAIIGLDEGILTAVQWITGERLWRLQRYGHGQILMVGQSVVIQAEDGRLVVVPLTAVPGTPVEIKAITKGGKTWNNPAFANGRLYLRNHEEMVCYEMPGTKGPAALPSRGRPVGAGGGPGRPPGSTPPAPRPTVTATAPAPTATAPALPTASTPQP